MTFTLLQHPLVADRVGQVRNVETGTTKFNQCLRDLGLFLTYQALSNAPTTQYDVTTPLQKTTAQSISVKRLKAIAILRAGLGLLEGGRLLLPDMGVGHIGCVRNEESLSVRNYYTKLPQITAQDHVFVYDPMIATGGSACSALEILLAHQKPQRLVLLCALCAPEGVERLEKAFPELEILSAALDERLNEKGYILPGLGDAGDRLFGT